MRTVERIHPACTGECVHQFAVPGPHPMPRMLPSLDRDHYPVLAGPSAYLPSEPGPVVTALPVVYCGPGAPMPLSPAMHGRRPDEVETAYPEAGIRAGTVATAIRAPVLDLARYAMDHGWEVRIGHSRGCIPHVTTARPGAVKDRQGVWMRRAGVPALAVSASGASWTWETLRVGLLSCSTLGALKDALV